MFSGWNKDGEALYDTKQSAIERAVQMKIWDDEPDTAIMIHRQRIPLWFAHLVRETWFERLAYYEYKTGGTR
jgi:hypothetical protein